MSFLPRFKQWLATVPGASKRTRRRPARARGTRRASAQPCVQQLETRLLPAGTWAAFANDAPDGIGTMILMTDGSVMALGSDVTNNWYRLVPGADGNYSGGSWHDLPAMGTERLFFASNVLHDGRVFVLGGEYSGDDGDKNFTNTGEMYDVSSHVWTPIANFPESQFGDVPSMLLNNGQILCGSLTGSATYLYDPISNHWTPTGSKLRNDRSDEETWLKLPDGSVLSYDVFNDLAGHSTAQRYIPSTGQWVDAGTVPVDLTSDSLGEELGGATLMTDGRAWFVGATGHTAFYTPSTNTWAAGPDLPNGQHADDAPLCQMVNGHVLVAADGPGGTFSTHTHVYDYNPFLPSTVTNPFTEVDPEPLIGNNDVSAFRCRMLALPNGQVLFERDEDSQLWTYTPDSGPQPAWRPTITGISPHTGFSLAPEFVLTGTQLNGTSAGASYGDDAEMDSNYPIVQYTDKNGHVGYAQGFDRSSNGVQTGSTLVSTSYFLPPGFTDGAFLVRVMANGIASKPVLNVVMDLSVNNVTLELDPIVGGLYDVLNGSTLLSQWATGSFSAIDVTMENTGGTVNVLSTLAGAPVNVYGGSTDTINIGNGNMFGLRGIQGAVNVENLGGFSTITIDDSRATAVNTHTIMLNSVTTPTILNGSPGASGQLTGVAVVPITWKYADTAQVTIRDAATGNTWNIQSTGTRTNIVASGADTINVGTGGSVQGITGTLNIEDPPDFNTIMIDDSADTHARTVTLSTLTKNPNDFSGGSDPWGQITGLAPATINFEYADTSSVTVQTGTALGNVVNVLATGVRTNLVSHWFDTVNVGSVGSLAGIVGTLNIEDPPNRTNLNIDDSSDTTARTVLLRNIGINPNDIEHGTNFWGQISGLCLGAINFEYADTADVTVSLGNAANTVNVEAAQNNGTLFIHAQAATTVNVGNDDNAQGVTSLLSLTGPNRSITLTVNDSADTIAHAVTVSPSSVIGLARGFIEFTAGQVVSTTLSGGSGTMSYAVTNILNGTSVAINPGKGNDTVTFGNAANGIGGLEGLLTVNGVPGHTTLVLDDRATTGSTSFLVLAEHTDHGFTQIDYTGLKSLVFDLGNGGDEVDFLQTPAGTSVTVNDGTGGDMIHAGGTLIGNIGTILGPLTIQGQGNTQFLVFDQSTSTAQTYTLTATAVKRTGGFAATYSNLQSVTVNGGSANNVYSAESSAAGTPLTINAGGGNDLIAVSSSARNLSNLGARVTLNGGGGTNVLRINDQNAPAAESYLANAFGVTRPGSAGVTLSGMQSVTVNGGGHDNSFHIPNASTQSMVFNGGAGTDTLVGLDNDSLWTISSAGGGRVGNVTFAQFENLVGGAGLDVFKFTGSGSIAGNIDGGGAPPHQGNWLDYSALATTVTANLATGAATGVAGTVANIQNVHGSNGGSTLTGNAQGNILIGGIGPDSLTGGSGASLLIGDKGADQVTGGSGGDTLIGDLTSFDVMTTANEAALMGILAEWQSADSYATRFTDINTGTGGGLNGTAKLNFGTTVKDDSAADVVTAAPAAAGLDWFFQGFGDTLNNLEPGEHINNNTPAAFADRTVTLSGQRATVSGIITDPDPKDSFTLVIDWGDGSPLDTYTFGPGLNGRKIAVWHRYEHAGSYSIGLSWTDPLGPANRATLPVTVPSTAKPR